MKIRQRTTKNRYGKKKRPQMTGPLIRVIPPVLKINSCSPSSSYSESVCVCVNRVYDGVSCGKPVLTDRNWQPLKPGFGSQGLGRFRCMSAHAARRRSAPSFPLAGALVGASSSETLLVRTRVETSSLCVKTNCRRRSGGRAISSESDSG